MRMTTTMLAAAMLATLLAGCVQPPEEDGTADDGTGGDGIRFTMDLIADCHHTYPDSDEPIRCENELPEATVTPGSPPAGLLCVDEVRYEEAERGVRLLWNETGGHHVLHYWSPLLNAIRSGIAAVVEDDEVTGHHVWNHGRRAGHLDLPALPAGATLSVWLFGTAYESERAELQGGAMHVNWSLHDGDPYPVRVLVTPDGEAWYFPYVSPFASDAAAETRFPYRWGVVLPMEDEVRTSIEYVEVLEEPLQVGAPGAC